MFFIILMYSKIFEVGVLRLWLLNRLGYRKGILLFLVFVVLFDNMFYFQLQDYNG